MVFEFLLKMIEVMQSYFGKVRRGEGRTGRGRDGGGWERREGVGRERWCGGGDVIWRILGHEGLFRCIGCALTL